MRRRDLLKAGLALPLLPAAFSTMAGALRGGAMSRVRPGDAAWPDTGAWEDLRRQVGGRLLNPVSPFSGAASATSRAEALRNLHNPYYLGDQVSLTQTSGWFGAWTSQPSPWAVAAESAADVAAAVNFARTHRLRLVVKGGGHSYQGTSCGADALLVWTRPMNAVTLHDAFVPEGCEGHAAEHAVSLGGGCIWMDAYDAVTTRGGRYVQGGGCLTVGVAGLVQGGGFGHFSKRFGSAASNLLEAEVVTADGRVVIANPARNPDLFWALKGGGGGSFGVVTRVTLRTYELPQFFGGVGGSIRAATDEAFRALLDRFFAFYANDMFNPRWGEHITLRKDNVLNLTMMFQDMDDAAVKHAWSPFIDWVGQRSEYTLEEPVNVLTVPAQHLWDGAYFHEHFPGHMLNDERPGAPARNIIWNGQQHEAGWFIHDYRSIWLPSSLLDDHRRAGLVDTLFRATRHHGMELFFGKGMAGGTAESIRRTRDTSMNPQVLDAFALVIMGADAEPAYPGMDRVHVDAAQARRDQRDLGAALAELRKVAPAGGAYVSESDYHQPYWQSAFWGSHYPRLLAVKRRYDPEGLFVVHHGVGSEDWSADGFTRRMG